MNQGKKGLNSGDNKRQQFNPVYSKKRYSIETDKLDYLLDMIGELVIAESLVTQNPDIKRTRPSKLFHSVFVFKKLFENLQEVSLQLRMITLEGLFNKMERLCKRPGPKNRQESWLLQVKGKETEIDKNALEILTIH